MRHFLREYYIVTAVSIAILIGVILQLTNQAAALAWLFSVFSLLVAAKLFWEMILELKNGKYGVDILAIMAIISTIVVGEYWATIVIVLMLTGGEALEDYAGKRATRELTALLARAPLTAHRQNKDGSVQDIPVKDVQIGDTLSIKPAEVIPVDATLLTQVATFDESSLTGESLPVEHKKGQALLSGSVNGDTAITVKAIRAAKDSQYQQIIELVKAATGSEAPFVRLADRYAVPFTVISLLIAGLAWGLSGNALRFAEVLVVATPCPLLLGAPIAFISGMSRSAKHGIIVKNGATLEKLARIQTAAFDKTGTLTYGQPEVAGIIPIKGIDQKELLKIAASAEHQSAHTLAQALQIAAKAKDIPIVQAQHVKETTAQGVEALIGGQQVLVGKISFLRGHSLHVDEPAVSVGETAVYIARDGTYIGAISFADKLRQNSKETLQQLSDLGVKHTLMLTGDATVTAQRIAAQLGIEHFHAESLPKNKVDEIKGIKERPVMMVGDGVNDAPVLAVADVGVAMGARGSTAASETANVVILLDDISRVALAVSIARRTMRIALQSIWIGIAISIGLMLVAATGVIPAVVGAGLQEVVDVVVIFNALRAHGSWIKTKSLLPAPAQRPQG
jgi:heavy metal translocating P-type ATPase